MTKEQEIQLKKGKNGIVRIHYVAGSVHFIYALPFYHLELVTPVEELEPYSVEKNIHGWIVYKDNPGNVVANFNNTHPHAKEAAEAERDRLNAEHGKEGV